MLLEKIYYYATIHEPYCATMGGGGRSPVKHLLIAFIFYISSFFILTYLNKIYYLYIFISLKNKIDSYIKENQRFGINENNNKIIFDKYAYYYISIDECGEHYSILHFYCNENYIIFRYNNSLDLENNGSSRYSIIKKVNSVEFNVDSIDHVRNGIKKLYRTKDFYKLYDYYNKDYDLYKLVEKLLNKKDDWIIKSIYIILGIILTKSTDYIISIIISK